MAKKKKRRSPPPASPYTAHAAVLPTPDELRVDTFRPREDTPGDVGVCFSGGGSRALSAAMGQLRGLHHLGLLGQVKAISSVSGGSWATVPFSYLPDPIPDQEFLGGFVEDPHELTLTGLRNRNRSAVLDYLPPHNLGTVPAQRSMGLLDLLDQAADLWWDGAPVDRLWTLLVGRNVLAPFGLANFDDGFLPREFFTLNTASAQAILADNPGLPRRFHTLREPGEGIPRPFHICNFSMFVMPTVPSKQREGFFYLAPVQATASFTAVFGSDVRDDMGGRPAGGGGVTSFAFPSHLDAVTGDAVQVTQAAPLALADITAMSSAAFAETLENRLPEKIEEKFDRLNPMLETWPVGDLRAPAGSRNVFADGGNLENTGLASLLAYQDIRSAIVFVNSLTAIDRDGGGNVVVDSQVPPLFGFQPYQDGRRGRPLGYQPYPPGDESIDGLSHPEFRHSQVLPAERFQEWLDGIWQAVAAGGETADAGPAVFVQRGVEVQANSWFGVHPRPGRTVDLVWVYLNRVQPWCDRLRAEVRLFLPREFPHYPTFDTHLSARRVNLLAHFTSWVVASQAEAFTDLFRDR